MDRIDIDRLKFIHEFDLDADNFQIYLIGIEDHPLEEFQEPGVEFRLANRFMKNLDILTSIDEERPVLISMKTCGGDVTEGMAIYDAIIAAPNPITVVNYTHARSMSSIILQAANKRIMMPNSYFLFHEGEMSIAGTMKQVNSGVGFDKHTMSVMLSIYSERMKTTPGSKVESWSIKRIQEWLQEQMDKKEDVYMTAQEAVSWGFADEIFSDWSTVLDYTPAQKKFK